MSSLGGAQCISGWSLLGCCHCTTRQRFNAAISAATQMKMEDKISRLWGLLCMLQTSLADVLKLKSTTQVQSYVPPSAMPSALRFADMVMSTLDRRLPWRRTELTQTLSHLSPMALDNRNSTHPVRVSGVIEKSEFGFVNQATDPSSGVYDRYRYNARELGQSVVRRNGGREDQGTLDGKWDH